MRSFVIASILTVASVCAGWAIGERAPVRTNIEYSMQNALDTMASMAYRIELLEEERVDFCNGEVYRTLTLPVSPVPPPPPWRKHGVNKPKVKK